MGINRRFAFALICSLALGGCFARTAPPAPVVDKTGQFYGPAEAAAQKPKQTRVTATPLAILGTVRTSRRGAVTVKKGDTLYSISRRHKVPLRALIDANHLRPPYALERGARLTIPAVRVYVVAKRDNVYAIARRFNTTTHGIIRENGLRPPSYRLIPGQSLTLPWRNTAKAGHSRKPGKSTRYRAPATTNSLKPPPRSARTFHWPVRGRLLSRFGSKGGGLYNDGINIAARAGTPVRAAENGVVAYAGNELRGYGNLLLVRHAGGWVSAYAHNGKLLVKKGQVVRRGQAIARVGQSGTVTRPQLHFELRRGRRAVDPRRHMSRPS